jgi:hypothetical protein
MVWIKIIVAFVYLTSQRYKSNGHVLITAFENSRKTVIVHFARRQKFFAPNLLHGRLEGLSDFGCYLRF